MLEACRRDMADTSFRSYRGNWLTDELVRKCVPGPVADANSKSFRSPRVRRRLHRQRPRPAAVPVD